MVEKKRFDGSDATGATGATGAARATGMLRALRARAAASGAGRGVIAAVTSVAAVAMLGAVCVTPASARGCERRRGRVRRPVRGLRDRLGRNLIRRALAGAVCDFRDASGRERCDGRR